MFTVLTKSAQCCVIGSLYCEHVLIIMDQLFFNSCKSFTRLIQSRLQHFHFLLTPSSHVRVGMLKYVWLNNMYSQNICIFSPCMMILTIKLTLPRWAILVTKTTLLKWFTLRTPNKNLFLSNTWGIKVINKTDGYKYE